MKKIFLVGIGAALLAAAAFAADPAWWTDSAHNTNFIDTSISSPNNYTVLNLGQLKNVAVKAKNYLDIQFAPVGGAGPAIDTMVGGFSNNTTLNYQPANLGQLKAVAKPFYDRLIEVGYDTRANLIARGYSSAWPYQYPWDPYTPVAQNYAPANLGQIKMIFSFDVGAFVSSKNWDADNDGLLDSWERRIYGNTSATLSTDHDGDGVEDYKDADPANSSIRALSIAITYPANNSTL